MDNRYKLTEVLQEDGTYSAPMPIEVDAENVIFDDNENLVVKLDKKALKKIYGDKNITFSDGTPIDETQEYFILLDDDNNIEDVEICLLVDGKENVLSGKNLIVVGNLNTVEGQQNNIHGSQNDVFGNNNTLFADESTINGNNNILHGINAIQGDSNIVIGENNYIEGNNNFITGEGNIVNFNNAFVSGKGYAETINNSYKAITNGTDIISSIKLNDTSDYKGKITAKKFDGKVSKDTNGNIITKYIKELGFLEKGGIIYTDGDGKITRYETDPWEYYPSLFCNDVGIKGDDTSTIITLSENDPAILLDRIIFCNNLKVDNKVIYFMQMEVMADLSLNDSAVIKYDLRLNNKTINNFGIPAKVLKKEHNFVTIMETAEGIKYLYADGEKAEPYIYGFALRIKCTKGTVKIKKRNFCSIVYGSNIQQITGV